MVTVGVSEGVKKDTELAEVAGRPSGCASALNATVARVYMAERAKIILLCSKRTELVRTRRVGKRGFYIQSLLLRLFRCSGNALVFMGEHVGFADSKISKYLFRDIDRPSCAKLPAHDYSRCSSLPKLSYTKKPRGMSANDDICTA
jgi:hypothetical protein